MSDLRTAAQALVNQWESNTAYPFGLLVDALRAALAQPEPEPVAYTDDVTRIMREAGMTFHLGHPHKAVIEQMTRVFDLVCAEASIKAAQKFAVALAQPELEPVAWLIQYENDEREVRFVAGTRGIRQTPLYAAPPQRKPLTDEALMALLPGAVRLPLGWKDFARAIERAHGIGGES